MIVKMSSSSSLPEINCKISVAIGPLLTQLTESAKFLIPNFNTINENQKKIWLAHLIPEIVIFNMDVNGRGPLSNVTELAMLFSP